MPVILIELQIKLTIGHLGGVPADVRHTNALFMFCVFYRLQ